MEKVLITGAGGFIGHHLARFLKQKGYWVRGVDIKYPEFSSIEEMDEFLLLDLRDFRNASEAVKDMDYVYTLAANMGGIGFITDVRAEVMRDNVLINVNMAEASRLTKIKKIFYSSSACVYPTFKQEDST
jgi:nucleoside-diphosphate-sugar epimerase